MSKRPSVTGSLVSARRLFSAALALLLFCLVIALPARAQTPPTQTVTIGVVADNEPYIFRGAQSRRLFH